MFHMFSEYSGHEHATVGAMIRSDYEDYDFATCRDFRCQTAPSHNSLRVGKHGSYESHRELITKIYKYQHDHVRPRSTSAAERYFG